MIYLFTFLKTFPSYKISSSQYTITLISILNIRLKLDINFILEIKLIPHIIILIF